jgi:hypothetical protein
MEVYSLPLEKGKVLSVVVIVVSVRKLIIEEHDADDVEIHYPSGVIITQAMPGYLLIADQTENSPVRRRKPRSVAPANKLDEVRFSGSPEKSDPAIDERQIKILVPRLRPIGASLWVWPRKGIEVKGSLTVDVVKIAD